VNFNAFFVTNTIFSFLVQHVTWKNVIPSHIIYLDLFFLIHSVIKLNSKETEVMFLEEAVPGSALSARRLGTAPDAVRLLGDLVKLVAKGAQDKEGLRCAFSLNWGGGVGTRSWPAGTPGWASRTLLIPSLVSLKA